MFQAKVNEKPFEIQTDGENFIVNGQPVRINVTEIEKGYFHFLYDHKSVVAEVVKLDHQAKIVHIKIEGNIYQVEIKDQFDLLLEKMGMTSATAGKVNNIKAPMPGLIIDLKINAGDEVKQGDMLLILEAMKMENIIKSPGDAVVKSVKVKKGDSVEKNQVLIEF